MRVCIPLLTALPRRFGPENVMYHAVRALGSLDSHNQYTLLLNDAVYDHFKVDYPNFVNHRVVIPAGIPRRVFEQLYFLSTLAQQSYDMVCLLGSHMPLALRGQMVFTANDCIARLMPEALPLASRLLSNMDAWSARFRKARVVAISHQTRDDLVRLYGFRPDSIVVSSPAVDHSRFHADIPARDVDACRVKYDVPPEFILFVGRPEPRKNLVRLVRALKHVRSRHGQVHLVIAGAGGWKNSDLYGTVRELGLEDAVHFPGFIPDDDLPLLYRAARIFAYVSLYEGFGLPVLEAMACGVPVVTSNLSSMREIGEDACVMVNPHDTEAIAEGLLRLLGHEELRREVVRKSLEKARSYTWERFCAPFVEIFNSTDGHGGRA